MGYNVVWIVRGHEIISRIRVLTFPPVSKLGILVPSSSDDIWSNIDSQTLFWNHPRIGFSVALLNWTVIVQLLLSRHWTLSNGWCPTVVVWTVMFRHWTVTVQRLLSNRCCLNYYCPTVAVQPLLFEPLLSNCHCLDIELLLSNGCCPTVVVWTVTIQLLLSNGCCPTVAVWTVVVQRLLFEHSSDF
jgi:hypothetical protein